MKKRKQIKYPHLVCNSNDLKLCSHSTTPNKYWIEKDGSLYMSVGDDELVPFVETYYGEEETIREIVKRTRIVTKIS